MHSGNSDFIASYLYYVYLIRHILRSVGLLSNGRRKQVSTVALMLVHVIYNFGHGFPR